MNVETMECICKDASQTFFNEFGLISHQINSFDPPFDQLPPLDMNVKTVERFCKCITNLLQWILLDKSSDKLIW